MNRHAITSSSSHVTQLVPRTETVAEILELGQKRAKLIEIIGNRHAGYFDNEKRLKSFLATLSEEGVHLNEKLRRADKQKIIDLFNEKCLKQAKATRKKLTQRTIKIPDDGKSRRVQSRRRAFNNSDVDNLQKIFENDKLFQMLSSDSKSEFFHFVFKQTYDFSDEMSIQNFFIKFVEEHTEQRIYIGDKLFVKMPRRPITFAEMGPASLPPLTRAVLNGELDLVKIILNFGEDPKRTAPFPDAIGDSKIRELEVGASLFLDKRGGDDRPTGDEALHSVARMDPASKFVQKTLIPILPSLITASPERLKITGCNALTAAIVLCAGASPSARPVFKNIVEYIFDWSLNHLTIGLVNVRDDRGETPLTTAVASGDIRLVERVLDSGAEVGLPNKRGCTSVIIAISTGRPEMLDLLLERDGDLFDRTPEGRCAFAHLREGESFDALRSKLLTSAPKAAESLFEAMPNMTEKQAAIALDKFLHTVQFIVNYTNKMIKAGTKKGDNAESALEELYSCLTGLSELASENLSPVDLLRFIDKFTLKKPIAMTHAMDRVLTEIPEFFKALFDRSQGLECDSEDWALLETTVKILTEQRLAKRFRGHGSHINECLTTLLKIAAKSCDMFGFHVLLHLITLVDKSMPVSQEIQPIVLRTLHAKAQPLVSNLRELSGGKLGEYGYRRILNLLASLNAIRDASFAEDVDSTLLELWSAILNNYEYNQAAKLIHEHSFRTMGYIKIKMLYEKLFLPKFNRKFDLVNGRREANNEHAVISAFVKALDMGQVCADVEEMMSAEAVQTSLSSLLRVLVGFSAEAATSIIAQLKADQAASLLGAIDDVGLTAEPTPKKALFSVNLFKTKRRRAGEFKERLPSLLSSRFLAALREINLAPRRQRGPVLAALLRSRSSRPSFGGRRVLNRVEIVWCEFIRGMSIESLKDFLKQLNVAEVTRVRDWVRGDEAREACKNAIEFAQHGRRQDVDEDPSD